MAHQSFLRRSKLPEFKEIGKELEYIWGIDCKYFLFHTL